MTPDLAWRAARWWEPIVANLDWLTASLSLIELAILARRGRAGWLVGIAKDGVWLVIALSWAKYGLLAGTLVTLGVKFYGWRRWAR